MKRLLFFVSLFLSSMSFAQNDVTKFLGIPVDGTKTNMIQKIKEKGYTYNARLDCLEGEFNGYNVRIHVVTNNNKVYRIMVEDVFGTDESEIKIRFNKLCRQFENNDKYINASLLDSQEIGENEDISYELLVNKKRYQASYYPKGNEEDFIDTADLTNYYLKEISKKYTEEELSEMTEEQIATVNAMIAFSYYTQLLEKKIVWFMINESQGSYYILMYYDNGYNQANGEDL